MKSIFEKTLVIVALAATLVASAASAQTPVYSATIPDAVTGDNPRVTFSNSRGSCTNCLVADPNPPAGAAAVDRYSDDLYERPTGSGSGATNYYAAIDIVTTQVGFDATYLYYRINLYGVDAGGGLPYKYGYEINYDGDARGDLFVEVNSPTTNVGTNWGVSSVIAYRDTNNDVGFTQITASEFPNSGDGYESKIFDQGSNTLAGAPGGNNAVVARVVPGSPASLEIAVKRVFLNAANNNTVVNQAAFRGNAGRGTWSPSSLYYHDKFGRADAGSPYPYLQLAGAPASCTNAAVTAAQLAALESGTHVNTTRVNPCYATSTVYEFDSAGGASTLAGPPVIGFNSDITVASSHTEDFIVGTNAKYRLTVSNIGGAATSGTITLTDTLPPGLTFVGATGSGWSCSAAGQVVTCTTSGSIANGGSSSLVMEVSVAAGGGNNAVSVSLPGEGNATNNSALDPTTVRAPQMIAGCRTSGIDGSSTSAFVESGSTIAGAPASTAAADGVYFEIRNPSAPDVAVEFFAPSIGSGPVRRVDFMAALNVVNGTGSVNIDAYNQLTSSWQTLQTVNPGATNVVVTATFTNDYETYLDSSKRMRMRIVSAGASARTVRVDALSWTMRIGYTVDNAVGNDADTGDIVRPFKTLTHAATVMGVSSASYVNVGMSRSGLPYQANVGLAGPGQSGTATCRTLLFGVADTNGLRPLVQGLNPSSDAGIAIDADYVTVYGFEIENTQVALYGGQGSESLIFENNFATVPAYGYGVLLYGVTGALALNNRIQTSTTGFAGIWDYEGTDNVIDGNRVNGFKPGGHGIWTFLSASPTVQRNIVTGGYVGVYFAHSSGTIKMYNNTIDRNTYRGVHSENTQGTLQSRNNIITNNPVGWGWDGRGTISSDYDDVFANTVNYTFNRTVTPGPNSISANPAFIQTTDPAAADYYQPNAGSPVIDAGTDVGLPFNGAPDIGAVER